MPKWQGLTRGSLRALAGTILCLAVTSALADKAIDGVVLATSDSKIVEKMVKQAASPVTQEGLEKAFPKERFDVQLWGGTRAVVIDRQLTVIDMAAKSVSVGEALLKHATKNLVINLGELPAGERAEVVQFLNRYQPPEFRPPDFKMENAAIGLVQSRTFEIEGPGRENPVRQSVMVYDKAAEERDKLLEKSPIPDFAPPPEVAERVSKEREEAAKKQHVGLHFFGSAFRAVPKATEEVSKQLDKLLALEAARAAAIARDLARKMNPNGAELPEGPVSLQSLPKSLRDELTSKFADEYQLNGFASREDAENYLMNCGSVRVSTNIGFKRVISEGDPAKRKARMGAIYMFGNCAGGISP